MTTPTATRSIEVVQNIVLDTIQPFIERLEAMEARVSPHKLMGIADEIEPVARMADTAIKVANHESEEAETLRIAMGMIADLHQLEAVPLQWVQVNGKQEAVDGEAWEITCRSCKEYKVTWYKGDPQPGGCKTLRLAKA